tara:strand:- start:260 stop:571 length:312 start_codon:yes stop_codon:yes gene_type:complete
MSVGCVVVGGVGSGVGAVVATGVIGGATVGCGVTTAAAANAGAKLENKELVIDPGAANVGCGTTGVTVALGAEGDTTDVAGADAAPPDAPPPPPGVCVGGCGG